MSFFSSIWHKFLGGKSTPWADLKYVDSRVEVKSYNKAFADKLRGKFGADLTEGKDDSAIIKLFSDRENIENEDPRLDVKHSGITEDGRIKMELDWNPAFIRHLADNGIAAETEDEAVQMYLSMLTHQLDSDVTPDMLSREDVDAAFHDLDAEAAAELEEAARQIDENAALIKKNRKPSRKRQVIRAVEPEAR